MPIGSYAELDGDSLWLRARSARRTAARWCAANAAARPPRPNGWALSWRKSCWRAAHARSCAKFTGEIRRHDDPVTRPSPSGEQLVSRLRALGRVAYHAPLIDFAPGSDLPQLPQALQQLSAGDLVFVLSQHSVNYADSVIGRAGLSWPAHLTYYAIGRTTGLALHCVSSLPVEYPREREISETLLLLPALQKLAGKRALILRGNGGRELLGTTLSERGADVSYYECYQRSPVHYDGSEQSAHWQRAGVDTLVVTSGEMLQQLYTLVPDYYRSSWLLRCRPVVVSERPATLARDLGWRTIRVADNADNDALIRALQ